MQCRGRGNERDRDFVQSCFESRGRAHSGPGLDVGHPRPRQSEAHAAAVNAPSRSDGYFFSRFPSLSFLSFSRKSGEPSSSAAASSSMVPDSAGNAQRIGSQESVTSGMARASNQRQSISAGGGALSEGSGGRQPGADPVATPQLSDSKEGARRTKAVQCGVLLLSREILQEGCLRLLRRPLDEESASVGAGVHRRVRAIKVGTSFHTVPDRYSSRRAGSHEREGRSVRGHELFGTPPGFLQELSGAPVRLFQLV